MTDQELLAECLYKEARGEGEAGMLAVGCVIRNRVNSGWGDWHHVITAKNQFSSMSVPSDPQYGLQPPESPSWSTAQRLAEIIYNGDSEDVTNGALYYANLKTATSGWFFNSIVKNPTIHPPTATIGRHSFFA